MWRIQYFLFIVGIPWAFNVQAGTGDIYVGADAQDGVVLSNVPVEDGFSVLVKAPVEAVARLAPLSGNGVASSGAALPKSVMGRASRYSPLVVDAARETHVDPDLLHAVIATESAYDPAARSPKGAQGLMQLLPETARRYGVIDAYDARQNILGGARYLSDLLQMFDQDVHLALAAYNAGEQTVLRYGRQIPPYRETTAYVPKVLKYYRAFSRHSL